MTDQTTAVLADSDQTESAEQTGPTLITPTYVDAVRSVRAAFPDWQTTLPTVAQVRAHDGCGQSRAVEIYKLVRDLPAGFDFDQTAPASRTKAARKPAPVRRPRPAQTEPKPATRTEPPELTTAEVDRIIAEFYGAEQTERPNVSIAETPDWAEVAADPAVEQTADSEAPGRFGGSESADQTPPAVRPVRRWPVLMLLAPAFVAIWSGWVGVGGLTGFGVVHPLPGIWDSFSLNTAITLPIGMEVYAAYALSVWLTGRGPVRARSFAKWSAIGALVLGAFGQVAYHLMVAAGITSAPWQITTAVACLPVAVLGMGAALAHLSSSKEN